MDGVVAAVVVLANEGLVLDKKFLYSLLKIENWKNLFHKLLPNVKQIPLQK